MKKIALFLGTILTSCVFAQGNFKFVEENHDFGQIPEGPQVSYMFEFTNVGDMPLTVSNVAPSCGCTIPDWSKEAVQTGGKGFIKAIYNTQNRVGKFNKSMTVTSDGIETTKQVYFSGEVMAAPAPADTTKKAEPVIAPEPAKQPTPATKKKTTTTKKPVQTKKAPAKKATGTTTKKAAPAKAEIKK